MTCLKGFRIAGIITTLLLSAVLVSMIAADSYAQKSPKKIGVFLNGNDMRKTVGYTRIGLAWGLGSELPVEFLKAAMNLKTAMDYHTKIETEVTEYTDLTSNDLLNTSIIIIAPADGAEFTPAEREKLKKYVELGGLIVVDAPKTKTKPGAGIQVNPFRKILNDIIPNERFEPIPNSHELYHCFFDFDDGPPLGSDTIAEGHNYIEGVHYKGRLAAILSEKGYPRCWDMTFSNESQLKFAVNMIVYSLIQEGGISVIY